MKRAVKLKRREMKREIKRLKEENKALKNTFPRVGIQKNINVLHCAKVIPHFMIREGIIEFAKEELAHNLGEYIVKSGFCAVTESDGLLGHEIRISCEIVK